MRALLLAGGLGTRLRPLTNHMPKCLVPINGVPLLDYWLNLLLPNGIDTILINTHYLPDAVTQHVVKSPWRDRITLVHEPHLLGTAGTVLTNKTFFQEKAFLVAHADNLTQFDFHAFSQAHLHRAAGIEATMMTFDTDNPQACGIIEHDDRHIVTAFHEKQPNPPGTLANGAIYIFEPLVLTRIDAIKNENPDLSTDILPQLVGKMQYFHNQCYLRDIGSIASLRLAEQEFPAILRTMQQ
ncbi:MAG: nucleotidyltransferase family protein [Mariprofundales bacterium]